MKTFVLDTNVLLHAPDSICSFKDNRVVIPMTVVEELDSFKKFNEEKGRSVRLISRKLDALRSKGKLSEVVKTKNGAVVKIEMNRHDVVLSAGFVEQKSDNQTLSVALGLKQKSEGSAFGALSAELL
jgi:PhoH-like ATPase